MQGDEFNLARIIGPVEPDVFFRDTWEKQPLHIARHDADYYRGLFALRDLDLVLAFTRPRFQDPGDFKPEASPPRPYIQGCLPDDEPVSSAFYPDLAEIHKAYARGKTLILTAMQQRWPPVAALCRRIEEAFGCPVHANLYLTPPGAQGFDAHFDTHEVFVLQIEGTKHWRFYTPVRDLPLADEWVPLAQEQLGPPTQEVFLEPGDLLYLPRGYVHEAFTSDRASMHLTVGVKVFRWIDLLRQALDDVALLDVRFREALPVGLLTTARVPTPTGRFRELLQALAERARPDEAIADLAARFLSKRPSLPGNYFAKEGVEEIGLDAVLEWAPGVICRVFPDRAGRVALYFPGGRLDGPPKIASALHFIARTRRFVVRALPDDLTADAKLVLARRLVRDRVLRAAQAPPGDAS